MRLARIGLGNSDVRRGWRDPWFLAALLAPLLLLPLLLGDPIGEPVADDYDYLLHVLFTKSWSWFDGGGAHLFWRPLGRQVYYATFAPWMLSHPRNVALLQLGCLCLAAALLYRAFARALGAPAAFAVSTGPWMMESSRLLVAWPACFQDTGALLFLSLAIHEAAAARLVTFLAAGLAALLCKEVAGVALVSILVCPVVHFSSSKERRSWIVSTGVLVAAWAALYTWIHFRASLQFPVPVTALSGPEWARALWLVPWWSFKGICAAPGERSAQRGAAESLRWLSRAESLQVDQEAFAFHESVTGKRAYALASLRFKERRFEEARSHLMDLLETHPGDVPSHRMLAAVEESLARRR